MFWIIEYSLQEDPAHLSGNRDHALVCTLGIRPFMLVVLLLSLTLRQPEFLPNIMSFLMTMLVLSRLWSVVRSHPTGAISASFVRNLSLMSLSTWLSNGCLGNKWMLMTANRAMPRDSCPRARPVLRRTGNKKCSMPFDASEHLPDERIR